MRQLARAVSHLQRSQLSVQALARLCNVVIFLLASRFDAGHLGLVALQGVLLALPYTLLEALIGRPLSAGVVPAHWNVEAWAKRAAAATMLPVGVLAYAAASIALSGTSPVDRALAITPVVLQLPLEALFWATARTRSPRRANLLLQLTAAGTVLGGVVFATVGVSIEAAAVPAQLAILAWALLRPPPAGSSRTRPTIRQSLQVGLTYCTAAAVDLVYALALPTVAGILAGQAAIVVMRAMDLAFGPFHVALSASTREDIVAGKGSRLYTGTRALTVALLLAVSAVILTSAEVRAFLATDLGTLSVTVVAMYCVFKALLMLSTWLAVRHMIRVAPRRFLVSALGSRAIAIGGLAVATLWVSSLPTLFLQLLAGEVAVVCWFAVRIRLSTADRPTPDGGRYRARSASLSP
jgi:hypothetical protein